MELTACSPAVHRKRPCRLDTHQGRNLGIEYSVLRRWKTQLVGDPQYAFPGKGKLKAPDEDVRRLKRELERVTEERDILKKALAYFAEDQK